MKKEEDTISLKASLKNLADGFSRFFKKQNKKPKFKSKRNPVQSYTTRLTNNNIKIKDNYLKLPKLGLVKFAKSREPKGEILSATVRKSSSGKYFVAIIYKEEITTLPKTNSALGIDLEISDFAITSYGTKFKRSQDEENRFQAYKIWL